MRGLRRGFAGVAFVALASACASQKPAPASPTSASPAPPTDSAERALDEVAAIHGRPGPWAVAGWRMGKYAMGKLGLPRGSFGVEIVHKSPRQVQLSCIADGAAAYSGASVGKLNLSYEPSDGDVVTVYRHKGSGSAVALRPSAAFRARYANAPMERARELGREVMGLPDAAVFEEVAAP